LIQRVKRAEGVEPSLRGWEDRRLIMSVPASELSAGRQKYIKVRLRM